MRFLKLETSAPPSRKPERFTGLKLITSMVADKVLGSIGIESYPKIPQSDGTSSLPLRTIPVPSINDILTRTDLDEEEQGLLADFFENEDTNDIPEKVRQLLLKAGIEIDEENSE